MQNGHLLVDVEITRSFIRAIGLLLQAPKREDWVAHLEEHLLPGSIKLFNMSSIDVQEVLDLRTDSGDHDLFAHYVEKEDLTDAIVNGWPVIALCGKIWVPSRDPEKFPVCPECKDLYDQMTSRADGSS